MTKSNGRCQVSGFRCQGKPHRLEPEVWSQLQCPRLISVLIELYRLVFQRL